MAALATLASPSTSASSFLHLRTQSPRDATRRRRLLLPGHTKRFRRFCAVSSLPDPPDEARPEYTPWLIAGLGNPGSKYHGTRHNVGFEMIDHISRAERINLNAIQSKALIGIGSIGQVPIILVKPQSYMNYSGESVGPLAAYYQVPLRHILLIYDEMSLPNGVLRVQKKSGHGHHNGDLILYLRLEKSGFCLLSSGAIFSHIDRTCNEVADWLAKFAKDSKQNVSWNDSWPPQLANLLYCDDLRPVKNVIQHLDGCRSFPRLCIGIGNPPGTMDMKAFLLQRFSNEERVQMDSALEQGAEAVRTLVLKGFSESLNRFNLLQKYKYNKV